MSYLVKLVIKFPIDWHSNTETLIFDRFSQKQTMLPLMKNVKFSQVTTEKLH